MLTIIEELEQMGDQIFFYHVWEINRPYSELVKSYYEKVKDFEKELVQGENNIANDFNKFLIFSVELSDPHWDIEDVRNIAELHTLIDTFDSMKASRWCNPTLCCIRKELVGIIPSYDVWPAWVIAGPKEGYTRLYWGDINQGVSPILENRKRYGIY